MACLDACAPTITPVSIADCVNEFMKGGYYKYAFMKCNADFDDVTDGTITDLAAWQSLIETNRITVSPPIVGSKTASSFTNLLISSCQPEVPVGEVQSFPFRSYNADLTGLTHLQFWADVIAGYNGLIFLAITCDEYVYRFEDKTWSIQAGQIHPEVSTSPASIEGTIQANFMGIKIPVYVPGITGIL